MTVDLYPLEMLTLLKPGDTTEAAAIALSILLESGFFIASMLEMHGGEEGEVVADEVMALLQKMGEVP